MKILLNNDSKLLIYCSVRICHNFCELNRRHLKSIREDNGNMISCTLYEELFIKDPVRIKKTFCCISDILILLILWVIC